MTEDPRETNDPARGGEDPKAPAHDADLLLDADPDEVPADESLTRPSPTRPDAPAAPAEAAPTEPL